MQTSAHISCFDASTLTVDFELPDTSLLTHPLNITPLEALNEQDAFALELSELNEEFQSETCADPNDPYYELTYDPSEPEFEDCLDAPPVEATTAQRIDLYTISEDGHFVGNDGFVVPKNFAEFHERFPRAVKDFVRSRWYKTSEAEHEDRVSELNLYLLSLPETSKYRLPGTNGYPEGCKDRIEAFHPNNAYGASAVRFFHYVNTCLMNHFCTLSRKANKNPVRMKATLSLFSHDDDGLMVDDDYIFSMSSDALYNGSSFDKMLSNGMLVNQYVRYVREHNPELISVLETISESATYIEARTILGMTENLFLRARNRLDVLHSCFTSGMNPPRQRKIYRPRANTLAKLAALAAAKEAASAAYCRADAEVAETLAGAMVPFQQDELSSVLDGELMRL